MDPLPETPTDNKHILVVCDYFSKWIALFALPDIRAETVAERLLEDVFSNFGMPECLHSDQGKQFESSLFQEFCRMLGIHKTRSTLYHPQSDGLVERMDRTIQNVLAAYVSDHQRDWDYYLAQTQLAYNTSQHSSTSYTKHFLLFGREARLPLLVLVDAPAPPQILFDCPSVSCVRVRVCGSLFSSPSLCSSLCSAGWTFRGTPGTYFTIIFSIGAEHGTEAKIHGQAG